MRIANKQIPIASGHTLDSVVSNAIYLVAALGLTAALTWPVLPVALPLAALATGSALFHATEGDAIWAQQMDAILIQWTMAALVALSVAAVTGWPVWAVSAPLPAVWALWWLYGHLVHRNPAVVLQGVLVLAALLYVASLWTAATAGVLILAAVAVQEGSGTHSVAHAVWHVLAAGAICVATWGLV